MAKASVVQPGGRPRRFAPDAEVRMITEATKVLLRRNDYEDVSVGAILAEAGLSTRSFYRHYSSKDELLILLYRQNAEQAAARLVERVAAANTPRKGVEHWVDELLSFAYDPRKARRVAIFDSRSARRAVGYDVAQAAAHELLIEPLREVLDQGLLDGSLPEAVPDRDARSIYALVWDVMRWQKPALSREEAVDHVLRFALPGLTAVPAG
jgi:AcrR family transcriptional regulator